MLLLLRCTTAGTGTIVRSFQCSTWANWQLRICAPICRITKIALSRISGTYGPLIDVGVHNRPTHSVLFLWQYALVRRTSYLFHGGRKFCENQLRIYAASVLVFTGNFCFRKSIAHTTILSCEPMREFYYLASKIRPPPSTPNFLFSRRRRRKSVGYTPNQPDSRRHFWLASRQQRKKFGLGL